MRAFLSVYHKEGIDKFARELIALKWELIASGGTAKHLKDAGIPVTDLADLTGSGSILGHKVVTLDRKFHAMLLADNSASESEELKRLGIPRIDLLYCDLCPLREEISNPSHTQDSVIKMTDIGGPAMIRAAAKGGRIVICDPADTARIVLWLKAGKPDEKLLIQELRAKAEYVVAEYGFASAREHGNGAYEGMLGKRMQKCLYGENRWQDQAALYLTDNSSNDPFAPDKFILKDGADRSFINFTDIDRLLQTVTHIAAGFQKNFGTIPLVAIGVKHGNTCGAAIANSPENAIKGMINGDPQAISGGWVLTNFPIKKAHAKLLRAYGTTRILDGVVAPSIERDGVVELARKSGKCRIVTNKALGTSKLAKLDTHLRYRYVRGGFLTQSNYTFVPVLDMLNKNISKNKARDLMLSWAIGSTSNSNTITLVRNGVLIANANGQQSRILACRLAIIIAKSAGHDVRRSTAYSDSFFPFIDGPKILADAGVKTLFVTKGSIRDKEVFEYLKLKGVMIYSFPDTEGRGFFSH